MLLFMDDNKPYVSHSPIYLDVFDHIGVGESQAGGTPGCVLAPDWTCWECNELWVFFLNLYSILG